MWLFTLPEISREFLASVEACGLGALRPMLYVLRRGGVSEDSLRRRVSLGEIQRRRCWRCAASVLRYSKKAKLLSELHKVTPSVLRYGEFIEGRIAALFADPLLFPSTAAWLLV